LTEGTTGKDIDLTETSANEAAMDRAGETSCFNIRKQISSTTYEVSVYFNQASRETMDDKILRLARGEALNENVGKQ